MATRLEKMNVSQARALISFFGEYEEGVREAHSNYHLDGGLVNSLITRGFAKRDNATKYGGRHSCSLTEFGRRQREELRLRYDALVTPPMEKLVATGVVSRHNFEYIIIEKILDNPHGYEALKATANAISEYRRKEAEVLGGEEVKTRVAWADVNVFPSTRDRGHCRLSDCDVDWLRKKDGLAEAMGIKMEPGGYDYGPTLHGHEPRIKAYLRTVNAASGLIQKAFDQGFENGHNVILGLASGSMSMDAFNRATMGEEKK